MPRMQQFATFLFQRFSVQSLSQPEYGQRLLHVIINHGKSLANRQRICQSICRARSDPGGTFPSA